MRLLSKHYRTQPAAERGMTLIEILVVVLIIGMILGMVGANVFGIFGEAKDKIAENEIRSMVDQVQLYRETRSGLPSELAELAKANLIKNAQEDGSVLDPWKRPYIYMLDQTSKDGFVIYSKGADENSDEDDIRSDNFGKK
ncbi:MAG: type II secretion system protein GspG [Planctomycetes bacterium]|nr:type II secretion system protein GspG [Planctomycetota bacterium]